MVMLRSVHVHRRRVSNSGMCRMLVGLLFSFGFIRLVIAFANFEFERKLFESNLFLNIWKYLLPI